MTGVRLGGVANSLANMGTAIIIAFIYGWKLTLLILAFMPLLVLGGFMQIKLLAGQAGQNKEALEGAGKVRRLFPLQNLIGSNLSFTAQSVFLFHNTY